MPNPLRKTVFSLARYAIPRRGEKYNLPDLGAAILRHVADAADQHLIGVEFIALHATIRTGRQRKVLVTSSEVQRQFATGLPLVAHVEAVHARPSRILIGNLQQTATIGD